MSFEPREWSILEGSARNMLMMHAQVDALSRMVRDRMAMMLGDVRAVEHLHVLDHLSRDGDGTCIAQIARALNWPRTTLTRVVLRMKAAGMVEIMVFDEDERRRTIWLTEEGQRQRVLLMERIAMELMKVEMQLRATKVASLREEARGMVAVLEKMGRKRKRRR